MVNSGIVCPELPIADSKLHRFKKEGDHQANSWYVLYDGILPAGAFGCWKMVTSGKWASKPINQLSPEEHENYKIQIEKAKAMQEAKRAKIHAESKKKAQQLWGNSLSITTTHSYLLKKKVKAHGIRNRRNINS